MIRRKKGREGKEMQAVFCFILCSRAVVEFHTFLRYFLDTDYLRFYDRPKR